MSVSRKLEADSARLRVLEDAINEKLAYVRGQLVGLRTAEAALVASVDTRPEGGDSTEIEAPFKGGAVPEGQTPE